MAKAPDLVTVGWPSVLGYARAGDNWVLNLFGFRVCRLGAILRAGFGS